MPRHSTQATVYSNPFLQNRIDYYNGVVDHLANIAVSPENVTSNAASDVVDTERETDLMAGHNPNGWLDLDGKFKPFNLLQDHGDLQPGDGYETAAGLKSLSVDDIRDTNKSKYIQQLAQQQIMNSVLSKQVPKYNYQAPDTSKGRAYTDYPTSFEIAQDPQHGVYFKRVPLDPNTMNEVKQQKKVLLSAYGPGKYNDTFWNNLYDSVYSSATKLPSTLVRDAGFLGKLTNTLYDKLGGKQFDEFTGHTDEEIEAQRKSYRDIAEGMVQTGETGDIKYQLPFNKKASENIWSSDSLAQGLGQGLVSTGEYLLLQGGLGLVAKAGTKVATTIGKALTGSALKGGEALSAAENALAATTDLAGKAASYPTRQALLDATSRTGNFLNRLNSIENLRAVNKANMFTAGLMVNGNEFYQQARQEGLDDDKAVLLSGLVGTANAFIDMMGANYIDNWTALGKYERKNIAKSLVEFAKDNEADLSKLSVQRALIGKYYNDFFEHIGKKGLGEVIKAGAEEGSQEFLQNYVDEAGKWFYNKILSSDSDKKFKQDDAADIFSNSLQQAVTGALSGVGMASVHAIGDNLSKNKGVEGTYVTKYIADGLEDGLLKQNQELFKSGAFSQQTYQAVNDRINKIVKLRDSNPDVFDNIYSKYKPEYQEEKINDALNTLVSQQDYIDSNKQDKDSLIELAYDAYQNNTLNTFANNLIKAGRVKEGNALENVGRLSNKLSNNITSHLDSLNPAAKESVRGQIEQNIFTQLLDKNYRQERINELNLDNLKLGDTKANVDALTDDKLRKYNSDIIDLLNTIDHTKEDNSDISDKLNLLLDKKYKYWKSLLPNTILDGEDYLDNLHKIESDTYTIQSINNWVDSLSKGGYDKHISELYDSIIEEQTKLEKQRRLDEQQAEEDQKLQDEADGEIVSSDPVEQEIETNRQNDHNQIDKSVEEGSITPEDAELYHSAVDQVHDNKLNEYQSTKLTNEVKEDSITPKNTIESDIIEPIEDTNNKFSLDSLLDTTVYQNRVKALYGSSKELSSQYAQRFFNTPESDMSTFNGELKLSTNYSEFKKDDIVYQKTTKRAGDLLAKTLKDGIKFEDLSKKDQTLLIEYSPLQIKLGNSEHKFTLYLYSESTGKLSSTQKQTRKEIISDLIDNGTLTLTSDQFSRSNGRWNYAKEGNNKLSDIPSLELSKIDGKYFHKGHFPLILAHADYTGTVRYLEEDNGVESLKIASGAGSPGSIYMIVPSEMTINKKQGTFIKLNPAKYDRDVAESIARLYLYSAEYGLNSIISPEIKKELNIRTTKDALYKDILYYVLNHGNNTIVKEDDGRDYLRNKQLFLDEDKLVRYNTSSYIDPTRFNSDEFNKFVDWLVDNKNYSINKLDLNDIVRSSFEINKDGNTLVKFQKGDNYVASLIDNGFILSDLNSDPKATLTRSADLIIDYKKQSSKTISNPTVSSIIDTKAEPTVVATPIISKPELIVQDGAYTKTNTIHTINTAKEGSILSYSATPFSNVTNLGTIHREINPVTGNENTYVLVNGNIVYNGTKETGIKEELGNKIYLKGPDFLGRLYSYVNKQNGIENPLEPTNNDLNNPKYISFFYKIFLQNKEDNPELNEIVEELPKIKSTDTQKELSSKEKTLLGDIMRNALNKKGGATYEINPTILEKDYEKINKSTELNRYRKFLSKQTGGDVKFVDDIIKVLGESGNARYAFAIMEQDGTTIFNKSVTGTLYHEAFHRVSLLYLSPEERQVIYKDARKVYNLVNQTDKQVEEYLADRFKEYIQSNTTIKQNKVSEFFKNLYQFFRQLFNPKITVTTVNGLFKAIDNSEYKYRKINKEALENFKSNYYTNSALLTVNDIVLENIPNTSVLDKINNTLTYFLLNSNNVFSIEDFHGYLDYKPVIDQINTIRDAYQMAVDSADSSDALKYTAAKIANMYGEISDKFFTVFKPMIETKLASFNLTKLHEGQDDENTDVRDLKNDEVHSAYEYSAKESATSDVRLLFASLRESDDVDPITFLPKFVDPNTAWFTIFNKLHTATNYNEMHTRLQQLSEKEGTDTNMYSEVLKRLDSGNEDFRTRFHSVFNKHRHNFVNTLVGINKDGSIEYIKFSKADINRRSASISRGWSNNFALNTFSNDLNKTEVTKRLTESTIIFDKLGELLRKNDSRLSYDKAFELTLKLFNDNNIQLDGNTLDRLLSNYNQTTQLGNLRLFYSDTNYGLDYVFGKNSKSLFKQILSNKDFGKEEGFNYSTILSNLKGIRKLAEQVVEANPSSEDDSVLGADGALVYSYSEHNFITQTFSEYLKDPKYINLLSSTLYNQNSYWLNQLKDPKFNKDNINIDTLLAVFKENSGDTGRDYLSISPREDILVKMGAIFNNKYILPTLANKRTYYFINGFNQINTDVVRLNINGTVGNAVNSATINYFKGVLIDEINAIRATYTDIQKFLDDNKLKSIVDFDKLSINDQKKYNYSNLVQNYHYGIKKESTREGLFIGGKVQLAKANGIKFRYFTSLNEKLEGKSKEEVLQYLDKLLSNTNLDSWIRNIINDKINIELNTLDNNSIIKLNDKRFNKKFIGNTARIENRLIPKEELKKYSSDYNDTEKIINAVTKYTVNNMISVIEFEKLLSGDLALYKNIDDRVKRYSALASTGTILRTDFPNGHELFNKTNYNSTIFNSNIINSTQVYNNLYDNYVNKYKELYNKFKLDNVEAFKDLTDEEIETKAITETKRILSGFKSTDQTDAQVYISPKFYRELSIRLGEWDDNKEIAYNLIESSKELSLEEEILAYQKLTMQPLKMVYYGPDQNGTSLSWIYDKMSLACIFGRTAKGRDIEHVYDMMQNKDIDMVKFDTAVKSGVRQGTTFYNLYKDGINSLENVPVYKQDIRFLRRQLNTDPHEIHDGMLGTQTVKIGVHGINSDVTYSVGKDNIKGSNLIEHWIKSINQLTRFGKGDFDDRLSIKDGNISNEALLNEIKNNAIRSGMPLNLVDNLKLKEDENGTHYKIELSALPNMKWVESRLSALVKKNIVDINIPSGSFIQMSNFAFSRVDKKNIVVKSEKEYNYSNSGELNFRDPENRLEAIVSINLFKHLIPKGMNFEQAKKYLLSNPDLMVLGYRIPTQGQNSIAAIHIVDLLPESTGDTIVLPAQFTTLTGSDFDIDKLYVARYNYRDVDGELQKINFVSEEGKSREAFLKELYTELYGDDKTRTEAKEWYANILREAQRDILSTGSFSEQTINDLSQLSSIYPNYINTDKLDTYIDDEYLSSNSHTDILKKLNKLFINKPSYETFVNNSEGKTEYDLNSRKAIQNRLVDIYLSVLTNDDHTLETTTPLDATTEPVKNVVRDLDKFSPKMEINDLTALTPTYQTTIKTQNTGADKGIGPMALSNTHTVLAQIAGLKTADNPILSKLNMTDLGVRYDRNGTLILDWTSALINAHVDAAKDPYILKLNVNQYTYNTTAFMIRSGVGESTFYFLPQPILKEISDKYLELKNGKIGVKEYELKSKKYIKDVETKYKDLRNKLSDKDTILEYTSTEDLVNKILDKNWLRSQLATKEEDRDANWYNNQLLVLDYFKLFYSYGEALGRLVQTSQIDTGKYGNNSASILLFLNKYYQSINDKLIANPKDIFDKTFLGDKLKNSIEYMFDVFGKEFLEFSPEYINLINNTLNSIGKLVVANDKLVNTIARELKTSISTQFFNNYLEQHNKSLESLFYGENSVVNRVIQLRNDILSTDKYQDLKEDGNITNPLLNLLQYANLKNSNNEPDIFEVSTMKQRDTDSKNLLTYAWRDLLSYPDDNVRNIANDLILYAYYTSGGTSSGLYNIFDYVPYEMLDQLKVDENTTKPKSYSDYIRDIIKAYQTTSNEIDNSLLDNTFRNLSDNSNIVPFIDGDFIDQFLFQDSNKDRIADAILLNQQQSRFLTNQDATNPYNTVFIPYINYNNTMYKFAGVLPGEEKDQLLYHRANKLGYNKKGGITIKEYGNESKLNSNINYNGDLSNIISKYSTLLNGISIYDNNVVKMEDDTINKTEEVNENISTLDKNKQDFLDSFDGDMIKIDDMSLSKEDFNNLTKEEQDNIINCHGK